MYGVSGFRAFIVLLLSLTTYPAHAAVINMSATLSGTQEVPPNGSAGTGSATIVFDDVSNELSWDILFSDLSGPATAAHFHGPAPVGTNAGVQVDIGAVSGLNSPMMGSATISDVQEADLLAGLWYINIHTSMFPGGEIRGQVLAQAVPIPAAAWLLVSGLTGLMAVARTRRR